MLSLRPAEVRCFDKFLAEVLIPAEFLRQPKKISEINFWKANDFKFLFLHFIPLVQIHFPRLSNGFRQSFCELTFAMKLLSMKGIPEQHIFTANTLTDSFLPISLTYMERKVSLSTFIPCGTCEATFAELDPCGTAPPSRLSLLTIICCDLYLVLSRGLRILSKRS